MRSLTTIKPQQQLTRNESKGCVCQPGTRVGGRLSTISTRWRKIIITEIRENRETTVERRLLNSDPRMSFHFHLTSIRNQWRASYHRPATTLGGGEENLWNFHESVQIRTKGRSDNYLPPNMHFLFFPNYCNELSWFPFRFGKKRGMSWSALESNMFSGWSHVFAKCSNICHRINLILKLLRHTRTQPVPAPSLRHQFNPSGGAEETCPSSSNGLSMTWIVFADEHIYLHIYWN